VFTLTGNLQSRKAGSTSEAFTLVEVLIVLTILSLIFTLLTLSFSRAVSSSLSGIKNSENLKREITLFWEMKRALTGARKVLLKGGSELFLETSGGEFFKGVVKKAYIFEEGTLYTYEFPYPSGSLDFYEEDKLIQKGRFNSLRFYALDRNGKHDNYEGLPDFILVELNGKEFTFKIK